LEAILLGGTLVCVFVFDADTPSESDEGFGEKNDGVVLLECQGLKDVGGGIKCSISLGGFGLVAVVRRENRPYYT
jgi:hypothetical protein